MLFVGHVPAQFKLGLTFPIDNGNTGGNAVSVEDLRGLTISSSISKIMEKLFLSNFSKYFLFQVTINSYFFLNLGCSHAIFQLDQLSSSLSIATLLSIFARLMRIKHLIVFTISFFSATDEKSVPGNIVIMLASWYMNPTRIANRNGALSSSYHVSAGVRQGGVVSPVIFANYVDGMINAIQLKGLGCHIGLKCNR